MAEVITPKRGALFSSNPVSATPVQKNNSLPKIEEVKTSVSFFKSKKFYAILGVVFIAVVLIAVVLLTGTEYNEEVVSKVGLFLPIFLRRFFR